MKTAMPMRSTPLKRAASASARRSPKVRRAVGGDAARRMATSEIVIATTVDSSWAASARRDRLPVTRATVISAKK